MGNTYFQFKQFTVQQQYSAMKVCTDACLFGAVVAEYIKENPVEQILDIGTGTGLLSLLLAQVTGAAIHAVEIDAMASGEAAENFKNSPWKDRLQIFNTDVLQFKSNARYDCIISNPPFFEQDLKSASENRNVAMHDSTLTLRELLAVIQQQLSPGGFTALLLPYHRLDQCLEMAAALQLFPFRKIWVQQTNSHAWFRGILFLGHHPVDCREEKISIKNEAGRYSGQFAKLLAPYYLHL